MIRKKCTTCGIEKCLEDDFPKDCSQPGGYGYSCSACISARHKVRRRSTRKIYATPRWPFNPEDAAYYVTVECEVCDTIFYPTSKWNKACVTCSEVTQHIYSSLHGIGGWDNNRVRLKVIRTDLVEITKNFLASFQCLYCNRSYTLSNPKSLDHIVPKSKGGTNVHSNINICCLECNRSRGELLLPHWFDLCANVTRYHGSGSGSGSL